MIENPLISVMEKWYRCQDRFVIMYDLDHRGGCFIVTDTEAGALTFAKFATRVFALEWCYDVAGGANDDNA